MRTDPLADLYRSVGDDSSVEHKVIFHLATALEDIRDHNYSGSPHVVAFRALELANGVMHREHP